MKSSKKPPVKELYSILVLDTQWNTFSIDFIVELPKSSKYDAIMIVVNFMSKRAHFVPMHMIVTIEKVVRLFLY